DVVAAIRAAEHVHGDHEAMMAGTGRTSWRGATESWRARLSRACGGGGVDREPVRNPESKPTTNESWRRGFRYAPAALLNPRARDTCGAARPAGRSDLRRYSTDGKALRTVLLNPRSGANGALLSPPPRSDTAWCRGQQERGRVGFDTRLRRYSTRGTERPAALLNPRDRA